jgi:hypothetical protein
MQSDWGTKPFHDGEELDSWSCYSQLRQLGRNILRCLKLQMQYHMVNRLVLLWCLYNVGQYRTSDGLQSEKHLLAQTRVPRYPGQFHGRNYTQLESSPFQSRKPRPNTLEFYAVSTVTWYVDLGHSVTHAVLPSLTQKCWSSSSFVTSTVTWSSQWNWTS